MTPEETRRFDEVMTLDPSPAAADAYFEARENGCTPLEAFRYAVEAFRQSKQADAPH